MKLKLLSLGLAGLFVANGAMAEDFDASVTIQNTISIENPTALDFGAIYAVNGDDTDIATLTVNPDGTLNSSDGSTVAVIKSMTDPTPAEFVISGVGAYTDLTLTFTAGELTSSIPNQPNFTVDTFMGEYSSGLNDGVEIDASGGSADVKADDNGELNFLLGATLTTDTTGEARNAYQDGETFTGTYAVEVTFQ